jgi:hypothetical protein
MKFLHLRYLSSTSGGSNSEGVCELGYPRIDVLQGGLDNVRSEPAAISVKMSIYLSFQD